jgi:hypothetical protein
MLRRLGQMHPQLSLTRRSQLGLFVPKPTRVVMYRRSYYV